MINAYVLRKFVEAQIRKDLETAKGAISENRSGTWRIDGDKGSETFAIEEGGRQVPSDWSDAVVWEDSWTVAYDGDVMDWGEAEHIVRWDPDRVVADCESRLRLLSMIDRMRSDHCESSLRIMAMPYENVDGFAPEWKLS